MQRDPFHDFILITNTVGVDASGCEHLAQRRMAQSRLYSLVVTYLHSCLVVSRDYNVYVYILAACSAKLLEGTYG